MKYQFYARPVAFSSPNDLTGQKKYISGVIGGWINYTPEVYEEIMKEYEECIAEGEKIKLLNKDEEFTVSSKSDPNKKYIVHRHCDGSWSCECPGFKFRKSCSHIDKIKGGK